MAAEVFPVADQVRPSDVATTWFVAPAAYVQLVQLCPHPGKACVQQLSESLFMCNAQIRVSLTRSCKCTQSALEFEACLHSSALHACDETSYLRSNKSNMILSATDVVKKTLTTSLIRELSEDEVLENDHEYIRGDPETRGPCPCLNALCNQNYL